MKAASSIVRHGTPTSRGKANTTESKFGNQGKGTGLVGGKASEAERATVLSEFAKRGYPEGEALAAIQIESGWDPSAHHPVTKAGGLIGFMPFVLKDLGWTSSPQSFWTLSASQQAPWIGKYLDKIGKRWRVPGDTYLALAASGHVGDADDVEIYKRGTKAWELNPGWRGADGRITAGSIRALLLRVMAGGVPRGVDRGTKGVAAGTIALVLAALTLWWYFGGGRSYVTRKKRTARSYRALRGARG